MKMKSRVLPSAVTMCETNEVIVPRPHHETARKMVSASRLTWFFGKPGGGKSLLAKMIARELSGRDPVVVYCSAVTDISRLFGHFVLRGTETVFVRRGIAQALAENRFLILEEWALLPVEIKCELMALRSTEQVMENPMHGSQMVISPESRCICVSMRESMNCKSGGEALSALLSDFLIMEVPEPTEEDVREFTQVRFPNDENIPRCVQLWSRFRSVDGPNDDEDDNEMELSARAALNWMKALRMGLSQDEATVLALVNQYAVDADRHSAAFLKHQISD